MYNHFILGTVKYDTEDNKYTDIELVDKDLIPHPKYNKNVKPKNVFDVALIKLDRRQHMDKKLHTVCLWNRTYTGKCF